jgi:hypothetical protein
VTIEIVRNKTPQKTAQKPVVLENPTLGISLYLIMLIAHITGNNKAIHINTYKYRSGIGLLNNNLHINAPIITIAKPMNDIPSVLKYKD